MLRSQTIESKSTLFKPCSTLEGSIGAERYSLEIQTTAEGFPKGDDYGTKVTLKIV